MNTKLIKDLIESEIESTISNEFLYTILEKLSIEQRLDLCIDYMALLFYTYSDKFDIEFQTLFKSYLNQTTFDDQFLSDTKTDELNIIESEDHCDKSKLLNYLHTINYEYLYKKSDILDLTKTIINNLNTIYEKDTQYTLIFIHSLY